MTTDDVKVVLVKIHGIGQQPENWSADFDAALAAQLTPAELAAVDQASVWWAPLSRLPFTPTTARASAAAPSQTASVATAQAYTDYAKYLAASSAPPATTAAAPHLAAVDIGSLLGGLANRVINIGSDQFSMLDHVTDVANYIGNNRIRIAIQECLAKVLAAKQAAHPDATMILGSHSQGTIISYDVLRLMLGELPGLKVWVSMGCPLGWYIDGASWGSNELEMVAALRWLNWYDPQDIVGKDLKSLTNWSPAVPEDVDIDNVGHGLDAHDHWHNPEVVNQYVQLIRAVLA
jgi:hypothetical protein